ncbi:hypothetical protein, partial [Klebsiella michiganensis]|uniref:hypothetical protein n=1 Tax=Klebsiella michiganensis TaxID=1134687 RepID=UPI00300ACCEC
ERAASGKAVHSDNADVCRTSALSEEKRLAAQRLTGGVMARLYQLQKLGPVVPCGTPLKFQRYPADPPSV